ncbi:hypothetical protein GQ457_12G006630 [Hibiscus cannabinus]
MTPYLFKPSPSPKCTVHSNLLHRAVVLCTVGTNRRINPTRSQTQPPLAGYRRRSLWRAAEETIKTQVSNHPFDPVLTFVGAVLRLFILGHMTSASVSPPARHLASISVSPPIRHLCFGQCESSCQAPMFWLGQVLMDLRQSLRWHLVLIGPRPMVALLLILNDKTVLMIHYTVGAH